jgi:hypothetical protein
MVRREEPCSQPQEPIFDLPVGQRVACRVRARATAGPRKPAGARTPGGAG